MIIDSQFFHDDIADPLSLSHFGLRNNPVEARAIGQAGQLVSSSAPSRPTLILVAEALLRQHQVVVTNVELPARARPIRVDPLNYALVVL